MTTNEDNDMSPAVKTMRSTEGSTCEIDSYKDQPMFTINKQSRYPFSFGLLKARLILHHLSSLRNFVSSGGQRLTE